MEKKVEEKNETIDEDFMDDDGEDLVAASANFIDDDEGEGDWESQSDEDGSDDESESKSKKKKTEGEVDDVAGGELEGLKETAELYKSNIFKLEVSGLIYGVFIAGCINGGVRSMNC